MTGPEASSPSRRFRNVASLWSQPAARATAAGLALILLALVVGARFAGDFGINWDETADAAYGRDARLAYGGTDIDWESYGKRKYYGPAYFMVQTALADRLRSFTDAWGDAEARHFVNFASFLVAAVALYLLLRMFVRPAVALAVAGLFATQPLYVGHAFINGKDTPFMAIFLLALAAGLRGARRLGEVAGDPAPQRPPGRYRQALSADWRAASLPLRLLLLIVVLLASVAAVDRWGTRSLAYAPAEIVVRLAYQHKAPPMVNQLFEATAENASLVSLESYLRWTEKKVDLALDLGLAVLASISVVLAAWKFPRTRAELRRDALPASARSWSDPRFLAWLVLAAVAAGLATSVRSVGLFALGLIGVYFVGTHRVRSFLPLLSMVIVAAATAYAAWPFLWGDPLRRLQESLTFLAGNPNKDYVLFLGHATKGRLLPWFYLPSLMVLQFTESVWLLVLAGMVAPFLRRKVPHRSWLIVILALWLLLPTAPLILRHAWFYDNFRQFLFITPAVFILAAFGLDMVRDGLGRVGRPRLWPVLIALLLLPGVIAIVRLHPYEYTYFNSLVGGTRGAFRRFELDYWATSYSAAIKRLNATLPAGSVVAFLGTSSPAAPYARPDLVLRTYTFDADPSTVRADVLVATTRANADMDLQRFSCRVDDITVVGAILATVRDPAPCGQP